MWYEILPTYLTITTFLAIPNLIVYFSNKLLLSQPYRRRIASNEESYMYLRDGRLSNRKWAYDFFGLENIPDADKPKEEKLASHS